MKGEVSSASQQPQLDKANDFSGIRSSPRGRGRDKDQQVRCYTCGQLGHMSWDYLENVARWREAQITQPKIEPPNTKEEFVDVLEEGETLMTKRVLLKTNKDACKPIQRRNLFKTTCKEKGKWCKLINDNGNTNKYLIST